MPAADAINPDWPDWAIAACGDSETILCTEDEVQLCPQSRVAYCYGEDLTDLCVPIVTMESQAADVSRMKQRCSVDPPLLPDCGGGTVCIPQVDYTVETSYLVPPDLCDDSDDDYYMYEGGQPVRDAILVLGVPPLPIGSFSNQPTSTLKIVLLGTVEYAWQIWKCVDTDYVNEYRWYVFQWGYHGGGALWHYQDSWKNFPPEKICYEGVEIDAGYALCKAAANFSPEYVQWGASLDLDIAGGVEASGMGKWHGTPTGLAAVWVGDFEGTVPGEVPIPVYARIIGYI
ncbi:MAG TPA: hypothetical protein VI796_02505 [Candidatus Thermoplasmatota archaeon]|nr:hypothetical protein [Candidatus Thermoplasmatota archaeon]